MNRDYFLQNRFLHVTAVLLILVAGLLVRFYDLTDLPLDFNPTRQLHSAVIARGMYYEHLSDVSPEIRDLAVSTWRDQGMIEPQIIERLSASAYSLLNQEALWVPRVLSIVFWLIGALALYRLVCLMLGQTAAVLAFFFFWLLPFGAIASRAFMPDPLLVSAIVISYLTLVKWSLDRSWRNTIIAGLTAGFAIFIKSTAVFFILFPFAAFLLNQQNFLTLLKDKKIWILGLLTVLPYITYHIYGYYVTGLLASQFNLRFFPEKWIDPIFYLQWKSMVESTIGFHWLLIALVGTFLIPNKAYRWLLLFGWVGYFIYGMTFSYHIITHDYYQLPLVPLVAIGLSAVGDSLLRNLHSKKVASIVVAVIVLFVIITTAWDIRVQLKKDDYRHEAGIWQSLGLELGPQAKVVGLTHDYGFRLYYWGWVKSTHWMSSGDFNYRQLAGMTFDTKQLFEEITRGKDYFVITLFGEFESQPELKSLLTNHNQVYKDGGDYLIFNLKERK